MIYKDFGGKKLSALGLGCMRLPVIDGDDNKIDKDATKKMVAYAFEKGINYFDTAYGYHGGTSEAVIGEVLSEYPRDSFYLASKFPGFSEENMQRVKEIFEEQLKKCRVDRFDFYLFHCITESNIDGYLDPKYGIYDYLMKQKKEGRIGHLGFSCHCSLETLKRFLEAYHEGIEFGQIQLNWLDYKLQDAKAKVELFREYNLPVWIMEPVRGGKLVSVAPALEKKLRAHRPDTPTVEWAFRYLQTFPDIVMTLSGMSNMEQLTQNIEIYDTEKPLNEAELKTIYQVADELIAPKTLPCTSCRYCTSKCPMELDIPTLIGHFNNQVVEDEFYLPEGISTEKAPSVCISCRACEAACPQKIKISEMMATFSEKLG